jgi:hypothetical protein
LVARLRARAACAVVVSGPHHVRPRAPPSGRRRTWLSAKRAIRQRARTLRSQCRARTRPRRTCR